MNPLKWQCPLLLHTRIQLEYSLEMSWQRTFRRVTLALSVLTSSDTGTICISQRRSPRLKTNQSTNQPTLKLCEMSKDGCMDGFKFTKIKALPADSSGLFKGQQWQANIFEIIQIPVGFVRLLKEKLHLRPFNVCGLHLLKASFKMLRFSQGSTVGITWSNQGKRVLHSGEYGSMDHLLSSFTVNRSNYREK